MRMLATATNYKGFPKMPLNLKGVLMMHGLKQPDWAAAIIQKSGVPLSLAAGSLILNWNRWPTNTDAADIKRQTEAWLLAQGVSREAMTEMWEIDGADRYRNEHPVGTHMTRAQKLSLVEPLIKPVETEMLSSVAKRQFSLFRDPFQDDVTSVEDVFLSADQRYISEAMLQTAKHGGFLAVIGESGSGKSTLRKMLIERTRELPIRIIFPQSLDKSKLNASAISQAVINDIAPGQVVPVKLEGQARKVKDVLMQSSLADYQHVVLIEEAHDLTIQTIKHLKRFYELEDGFRKLLSIILVGQPELKNSLDERLHPEAREVIRRIEIAELVPLNGNLEDYLALKLKRVGKTLDDVFAKDAFDGIRARLTKARPGTREVYSQLYPLVVNNLVTKAMNRAADLGVPRVSADLVKEL